MAFGELPEGVYLENGKYFHKVRRLRRTSDGFTYDLIPRECAFPLAIDEESVHEAREKAAAKGLDFYDPRIVEGHLVGWLSKGRKRSLEWPANLGSGEVRYETEAVPETENPDAAAARSDGGVGVAPEPITEDEPALVASASSSRRTNHGE